MNRVLFRGHDLAWACCAASLFLLLIAPIFAFIFTGIVIINNRSLPRTYRLFLACVLAIAMSMMAGARPLDSAGSNDIDGYYYIYQRLVDNDISYLRHFGGGIGAGGGLEFGLPLLFYVWGKFLPPLSVNGLMFCISLSCSLLLVIWVEKTFYFGRYVRHPAMIGVCLLMLNLYFATQLSRQFFSLIILLYALTAQGRIKTILYLMLAASFHLTAIPFFLLYKILQLGYRWWLATIAAIPILIIIFPYILSVADVLPMFVSEKLVFYIGSNEQYTSSDITSIRMILLLSGISLLILIAKRFKPSARAKPWLALPFFACLVHISLLSIPLASLRATLAVHSIVPGLLIYKMFEGGGLGLRNLRWSVLNLLLFYKTTSYLTAEQSGNLFSTHHIFTIFFT